MVLFAIDLLIAERDGRRQTVFPPIYISFLLMLRVCGLVLEDYNVLRYCYLFLGVCCYEVNGGSRSEIEESS